MCWCAVKKQLIRCRSILSVLLQVFVVVRFVVSVTINVNLCVAQSLENTLSALRASARVDHKDINVFICCLNVSLPTNSSLVVWQRVPLQQTSHRKAHRTDELDQ